MHPEKVSKIPRWVHACTTRTTITTFLHPSRTCKGAPYLCQNGEISSNVQVARLHRACIIRDRGKG
uniref:Uncharacterized protein n=1 Tax=Cucumis melo TaxID=3656 RepID=A0A9I9E1K9_CUCME